MPRYAVTVGFETRIWKEMVVEVDAPDDVSASATVLASDGALDWSAAHEVGDAGFSETEVMDVSPLD